MKITLVNPPSQHLKYEPPLGLASLGAYLELHNIEVTIIDGEVMGYNHRDIYDLLKDQSPDFVGVSAFTYNRFSAFEIAKKAKQLGAKVVAGGPHVSFTVQETLSGVREIDYIVIGEGEAPLYNLLRAQRDDTPLEEVAGLAFRRGSEIVSNRPEALFKDLDDLPDPAWHLLPMDEYPFHAVMGARGCPNTCIFCASPFLWHKKLRFLSEERFMGQLKHLLRKYGRKRVHVKDDTFMCNIKRAKSICARIIEERLNITWDCLARVHPIDEELLKLAQKAGCDKIRFGIEAGNERILRNIRKNITKDQIRRAAAVAKGLDFKSVGTLFMLGHPGETMADLEETYQLCTELGADHVSFSPTMIFPGTELYHIARRDRLLPEGFSWNRGNPYLERPDNIKTDDAPLFSTPRLPGPLLERTSKRFYAKSFFTRAFHGPSAYDKRYLFETGLGVAFNGEENKAIIVEAFREALAAQPSPAKKMRGFYLLALYMLRAQKVQRGRLFSFLKSIF